MTTIKRSIRTARSLVRSPALPTWLRWLVMFGLLPIPVIPIDEAALLLAAGIIAVFYRAVFVQAWADTIEKVGA